MYYVKITGPSSQWCGYGNVKGFPPKLKNL